MTESVRTGCVNYTLFSNYPCVMYIHTQGDCVQLYITDVVFTTVGNVAITQNPYLRTLFYRLRSMYVHWQCMYITARELETKSKLHINLGDAHA